jgi:hypothetical protein
MSNILTLEKLKAMKPFEIFDCGIITNDTKGVWMSPNKTGESIRWVAVRGAIHDWAIYCYYSEYNFDWIAQHGNKVWFKDDILKLVPCDEDAFRFYRT